MVRTNSCGPILSANAFEKLGEGHALPVLAANDSAKRFKRHVMEIVLLWEYEDCGYRFIDDAYVADPESPYFENGFVVAGDDLPRFC